MGDQGWTGQDLNEAMRWLGCVRVIHGDQYWCKTHRAAAPKVAGRGRGNRHTTTEWPCPDALRVANGLAEQRAERSMSDYLHGVNEQRPYPC